MPHELPKQYEPGAIEPRWADYWLRERLYEIPTPAPADPVRPAFVILLPPPNVTGRMHIGHMLEHSETDLYVRWKRMRGFTTLWVPGTDHAGIATQMLVERQLASEGVSRRELGREKFQERVWQWKEHYGGAITGQMRRLGDSVDWSREYFTMDARLSRAVRECFVSLYEDGLVYRGKYIVNWCPRCETAISDLEVIHEDYAGKLYEIRYPVEGTDEYITVATTRPETMLGDTAVAVNPNDERYRHLHGKKVRLPLMNREIPIILDELANPEFGTGAVKVTPAHDPNDFEAGQRHNLPQIDVMDNLARMNENAGPYAGHDRFEARERVLHDLQAQGLLASVKDYTIPIGKCQRCRTIVEPRLSTQWFVAVHKPPKRGGPTLAEHAAEVARSGEIRFTPENYKTIYLNWMENIYDWCISRQLWWGHRIPAWHCAKCAQITVGREDPTRCAHCGSDRITQDPDVLDTWFSSALLPFTVFGWPEQTRDLKVFYPTTLMITGFDILFFWVERMIMMGCHFMRTHQQDAAYKQSSGYADRQDDAVPFREVYIHALVRDAERQKMSKTKGNVVDPIEVTERFGTDAVRFALTSMAAPGTDIAFGEKRIEASRNFANKIWNASRFLFMNIDRAQETGWSLGEFWSGSKGDQGKASGVAGFQAEKLEDRWILSRLNDAAARVNDALQTYRFHEAAQVVYHFFWDEFCAWYIELVKLRMTFEEDSAESSRVALENAVLALEASLRLLSPFMPFLTEEIWHAVYDGKPPLKSVSLAPYPLADRAQIDRVAESEMTLLQDLIENIRNLRAELKVEQRLRTPVRIFADAEVRKLVEQNREAIERLANVESVEFASGHLSQAAGMRSTARFDVAVVYKKQIDVEAERDRLNKELEKITRELERARAQLANDSFRSKAPPQVVQGLEARAGELGVLRDKAERALRELGN